MSLGSPIARRLITRMSGSHLREIFWPALTLVFVAALLFQTNSVAAACNFLLKFGTTGTGPGQFLLPRGIAVDTAGNVYVADQNTRIQKFNSSGVFISQFGIPGDVNGGFVTPWKVATDSAGNVYTSDSPTGYRNSTPAALSR